eukprot:11021910-Karenia_brevis.AAC.1
MGPRIKLPLFGDPAVAAIDPPVVRVHDDDDDAPGGSLDLASELNALATRLGGEHGSDMQLPKWKL